MQRIVEIELSKQLKNNLNGYRFIPESPKIRHTAYYS